jgi:hypothetical protein
MKRIIVEFKEVYMDKPVIRECVVSSFDEVLRLYELNNSDIEYWTLILEEEV